MATTNHLLSFLDKIYSFNETDKRKREGRVRIPELEELPPEPSVDEVIAHHRRSEEFRKQHAAKYEGRREHEYQALMNDAVRAFNAHPLLARYQLSAEDLNVVAEIYRQAKLDFDIEVRAREIIAQNRTVGENLRARVNYIISLVDREILSFARTHREDYHYELQVVIENQYMLNTYFFNILMGKNPIAEAGIYLSKNLASSLRPMDVICKAIKIFMTNYQELKSDLPENEGYRFGNSVQPFMNMLLQKIQRLPKEHPLPMFIASHPFVDFEIKSLFLLYFFHSCLGSRLELMSVANLLACNLQESEVYMQILSYNSILRIDGLIKNVRYGPFIDSTVELSAKAFEELDFKLEDQVQGKKDISQLIKKAPFLSLLETKQTLDQLILPQDTLSILSSTITRLRDPKQFDLSRWGLMSASLSSDDAALSGCNILLHGHPGTGKTFVAGVIANELGRPLVQLDANNIRDSYYGETEKQVKDLFKKMREIIKCSDATPVFLLNEGDQIIHARNTSINGSTDTTENTIQSIFLEELETFPGILIVTTNLVVNMDVAMSRRFHYKLEMGLPDTPCRDQLWRLHLPASIPGADEINTLALAQEYRFTGGQIRIVVQNACYQAMLRGTDSKLILDDLCQFADMEALSSFEQPQKKIGFTI